MLPEAKNADLLYALDGGADGNEVSILTYPQGKIVGSIKRPNNYMWGICANTNNGNVWIVTLSDKVYEYSHGGTKPIAEVTVPDTFLATSCAVDPATNNLAVVNSGGPYGASVDIFPNGSGSPTAYSTSFEPWNVGYDDKGNLFADGSSSAQAFYFAELPSGGSTFTDITLNKRTDWPGGVQWDGKYMAVGTGARDHFTERIYRVNVYESKAFVISTVYFRDLSKQGFFWLQGNTLVAAPTIRTETGDDLWHYPEGGKPYKTGIGSYSLKVTVSVAPSKTRTRR